MRPLTRAFLISDAQPGKEGGSGEGEREKEGGTMSEGKANARVWVACVPEC